MTSGRRRYTRRFQLVLVAASITLALSGCAHIGRLQYQAQTVSPVHADTTRVPREEAEPSPWIISPMFGDTLIGLKPGTADSSRRYLGRLRDGYTADTLNIILLGDNRPGHRTTRLAPEYYRLRKMFTPNLKNIGLGIITIPLALAKGLWPDLALFRDIPGRLRHMPTWGPERKVVAAMLVKIDSLQAHGKNVAAVINTGDLVNDGRYPAHWVRFLKINQPLTSRVPYFAVAGNHERTDALDGIANWRAATGLPVGGERLYYCFDSADGWVRFIALDSNPMADPSHYWTREAQVKISDEEITWMVARLKEHQGPAFVFMHHPPFSVGFHRAEWQADSVLRNRRDRMMRALHEAGIGVLATGHEHAYERALFTWPDAVLINLVTGGGGAPLHTMPPPAASARLFGEYNVAGSVVKPENVFTGAFNHFIHVRLWFGGGEILTYAVDSKSQATQVDKVRVDLTRYGTPQIDQNKVAIAPKAPSTAGGHEEKVVKAVPVKSDSVATSKRILTKPSPLEASKQQKRPVAKRDTTSAGKKLPAPAPPANQPKP